MSCHVSRLAVSDKIIRCMFILAPQPVIWACRTKSVCFLFRPVMSLLLYPCALYHDMLQLIHEQFEPVVTRWESSMNIRRKRRGKNRGTHAYCIYQIAIYIIVKKFTRLPFPYICPSLWSPNYAMQINEFST